MWYIPSRFGTTRETKEIRSIPAASAWLFRSFVGRVMSEADFPRVELANQPTPLEFLPRLSGRLGGPPIFVKRDDLTGLAGGGNKARKLEFLAAEARARGADTLVTIGGIQSNHVRQTAAAAARLGLRCEVVLEDCVVWEDPVYRDTGNVLIDQLLGARIHVAAAGQPSDGLVREVLVGIERMGGRPYSIPVGGSTPLGALGYVRAVREIIPQLQSAGISNATLVVATGSGGTHAGILAGLRLLDRPNRVVGIAVSGNRVLKETLVKNLYTETLGLLGMADSGIPCSAQVEDAYVGPAYGIPTDATLEAVRLAAQLEGLLLDPVYTGKAMAGLIDLVRRGEIPKENAVVFWHTGGSTALFAYPSLFR